MAVSTPAPSYGLYARNRKPLKLFITGELESGDEASVLRAIGLLQSLLVRKQTNMKALALLLLDDKYVKLIALERHHSVFIFSKKLRDAAAAHLRHIATEAGDDALKPRDFAIAAYVEMLEDKSKKLRRASLIALGFLNAIEALR